MSFTLNIDRLGEPFTSLGVTNGSERVSLVVSGERATLNPDEAEAVAVALTLAAAAVRAKQWGRGDLADRAEAAEILDGIPRAKAGDIACLADVVASGIAREVGAFDARNHYADDEIARVKARWDGARAALAALQPTIEDDDVRECSECGDEVQTLSSDDLCDGCVAEHERLVKCPNCGERREPEEMNHWPHLNPPVSMCDSCEHNARRSGWEPGQ